MNIQLTGADGSFQFEFLMNSYSLCFQHFLLTESDYEFYSCVSVVLSVLLNEGGHFLAPLEQQLQNRLLVVLCPDIDRQL